MAQKIDVAEGSYILIDTDLVRAWLSDYDIEATAEEASAIIDRITDDSAGEFLVGRVVSLYEDEHWED